MDSGIFFTAVGAIASVAGVMYALLRNFKLDNHIWLEKFDSDIKLHNKENKENFSRLDKFQQENYDHLKECIFLLSNEFQEEFQEIKVREKDFSAQVRDMYEKFYSRFDKIDNEIKEIRTSVNRLEGAFYNQECCVVKGDKKTKKKAE